VSATQVAAEREALASTMTSTVAASRAADADRPLVVNATLEVEGETLARATHDASEPLPSKDGSLRLRLKVAIPAEAG